jgi:hypothetical protein
VKTDVQGCSTCPKGEERFEEFEVMPGRFRCAGKHRRRVQYDYRTPDGRLFSCIGKSLEDCRRRRDAWLETGKG